MGANKLFFIPTLAGGSTLDRTPDSRGGFFGLDLRHTREDIARATLEGISLNLNVLLVFLREYTYIGDNMLIVGGGAKSLLWRQIFADIYSMNVYTAKAAEDAGSFGAACLAAIGAGVWSDFSIISSLKKVDGISKPNNDSAEFYRSMMPAYKKLLDISSDVGEALKK